MYSKSPDNSLKACDCLNNNQGSSQDMKKTGLEDGYKNGISKIHCNGIQKKPPQSVGQYNIILNSNRMENYLYLLIIIIVFYYVIVDLNGFGLP